MIFPNVEKKNLNFSNDISFFSDYFLLNSSWTNEVHLFKIYK